MEEYEPLSSEKNAERLQVLADLDEFSSSCDDFLTNILEELEWKEESLKNSKRMVQCPVNSAHFVPKSALAKHIRVCEWLKEGYTKEEYEETLSTKFCYERNPSIPTIIIDQQTQDKILSACNGVKTTKPVPKTPERSQKDLTQTERLAIYDHVIQKAKERRLQPTVNLDEIGTDLEQKAKNDKKNEERKNYLEVMKEARDFKRRRQSYRAKNVHITKRSQIDVMREIIDNQMKLLEEVCGGQRSVKEEEMEENTQDVDRASERPSVVNHEKDRYNQSRNTSSPSRYGSYDGNSRRRNSSRRHTRRSRSRSSERRRRSRSNSSSRSFDRRENSRRRHYHSRSNSPVHVKKEILSDSENEGERSVPKRKDKRQSVECEREDSADIIEKGSHKHKKHKNKQKHKKSKRSDEVTIKDEPLSD